MTEFGDNLKRLRERAGLTQEALAALLKLKGQTPISLWEGQRKHIVPKPQTIRRLADAIQCEPWELLDDVETEYDALRQRRDLPDQSKGVDFASGRRSASSNPAEVGGSHEPSSLSSGRAEASIRANIKLATRLAELSAELQRLSDRIARGQAAAISVLSPRGARRNRKNR